MRLDYKHLLLALCLLLFVLPIQAQDKATNSDTTETIISAEQTETSLIIRDDDGILHDHEIVAAVVEAEEESTPMTSIDFLFSGKYLAFLIMAVIALALLTGGWINYWVRIAMLLIAFVLFGLDYFYPMHPSPMCAITKLFMFKFTWGEFFPSFIAMFLAIFIPSLIGRKIFCGWVCPLGALQDLINRIPHKWKQKYFNFGIFNGIRTILIIMFVLVFFGVVDHLIWLAGDMQIDPTNETFIAYSAYSIYEPINMFELLHWNINTSFMILFPILFISSLVWYRPFCYAICPIGWLTWLVEKVSPGRIRVDFETCTECGICYEKSPCPTIKPIVEKQKYIPDCTSCGECIKTCPHDSIKFGFLPLSSKK